MHKKLQGKHTFHEGTRGPSDVKRHHVKNNTNKTPPWTTPCHRIAHQRAKLPDYVAASSSMPIQIVPPTRTLLAPHIWSQNLGA